MSIIDITAPEIEPVSVAEAKEFLRIDHDHEDELIGNLITLARERVEAMGRLSLITRRRVYSAARPCTSKIHLNHSPVKYVHKVSVIDAAETAAPIPTEDLYINLRASPVSISANKRALFSDYAADAAAVMIEFDAGYGSAASDVPMQLRQAILLLVAQHYEHRDAALTRPVPMLVDALLMPYRTVRL